MPAVSLVIPTRDEADTICECIQKAIEAFDEMDLEGEIIVADNSTDRTGLIAASCGANVVIPEKLGYGNAYLEGFRHSSGRYIVMMDGDLTYDPHDMKQMIRLLQSRKFEMVMGSRLKGDILPGAMPPLHRYVGNPILTWILNKLFGARISDAHCGLRAITREGLEKLNLKTGGMELASEMVIEAALHGLRIAEVPITYFPRKGKSKLSSFSDGWRHLRFMMLYKPGPFLLLPGGAALILGTTLTLTVYSQGGSRMHSLILGSLLLLIGYQMLLAGLYFGAYSTVHGFSTSDNINRLISYHSLEKELISGMLLLIMGLALGASVLMGWKSAGYGALDAVQNAMMALILSILGIQTIISGMFVSLLLLDSEKASGIN